MLRELQKSRHLTYVLCCFTLVAAAGWWGAHLRRAQAQPSLLASLPRPPVPWKLDWNKIRSDEGGFVQVLHDGGRVELTLDPRLQQLAVHGLDSHRTGY